MRNLLATATAATFALTLGTAQPGQAQAGWAVPIGVGAFPTGALFNPGLAYAGPNYVVYGANGAPVELVYQGVTYYPAQPCGCCCGCRHHHYRGEQ